MFTYASDLCVLLVDNLYGELTSRIFKILLRDSRLSILALHQRTGLSPRQVQHGLSVLVQQSLVFWYTSAEESTVYEANTAVAYNLLRTGRYALIAKEQLGHFAGVIVSNLLLLGHARVGDLVQAYGLDHRQVGKILPADVLYENTKHILNESSKNEGSSGKDHISLESVQLTLCELLRVGFISLVNESYFRSEADNRTEAGKIVPPPEYFRAKSKRDNEAQRETAVQEKLEEWRHGTKAENEQYAIVTNAMKRPLEDPETLQAEKRRRLHMLPNGQALGTFDPNCESNIGAMRTLDNNVVLCINHDKFLVVLRNSSLTAIAEETICTSTSEVYAGLLGKLQSGVRECKGEAEIPDSGDEPELSCLPYVSTDDLAHALKDPQGLGDTLGKFDVNVSRGSVSDEEHPKKRRKKLKFDRNDEAVAIGDASSDEDEDESDPEDSNPSSDADQANHEAKFDPKSFPKPPGDTHHSTFRDHLLLLAKHPYCFVHHFPQTPVLPERWTVYYRPLVQNVAHHTLLQIVTTRYGQSAARLIRLLAQRGKVDEKTLCSLSLLNQKSMRSYLSTLHKAGMIQLQEIPRDNSRNPQRTLYLWFFDLERCKAKILQETYKTMVRCLQRVRVEGDKVKGTVEKANRSDVIGREEEFLGVQERAALAKWRQVEEKIWGEVGRLDGLVGLLRDF